MTSPQGLTAAEVAARRQQGKINRPPKSPTKTVGEIVRDNVCTYFNLVFLVLAVMLALVRSWLNMGFLMVVVCNTVIGVAQQLRAKHTIDALTLVSARKVRCLRGGTWTECLSEELVQDDVVEFAAGDQIVADAVVLDGEAQANESLITGEARAVAKRPGEELRSGSFLAAGRCTARLTHVGAESYANRLTDAARRDGHKVPKGEMMRSLDKLIRGIGLMLVPVGAALLYKQYIALAMDLRSSVEGTVAALVGMIPEGLYLLTSVALAVGMIRLARRRVLTQDMNCIETLARVDVLCVDKTGTITESVMVADDPVPLCGQPGLDDILQDYYGAEQPDNDTGRALKERFGAGAAARQPLRSIPFNTAYKYSAKTFGAGQTYVVGAPDVLAGDRRGELAPALAPLLAQGRRVLLLARYNGELPAEPGPLAPEQLVFLALLPLQNRVRPDAPETFAYFARQGVQIKVISGDAPAAVSHVAAAAGIAGAQRWADAAALTDEGALARAAEECTVFGRVTPEQKRKLVGTLQAKGHTVAMVGDGVNDVLALKDADCGIAMASGAQAASQIAQLVLLDSDFSVLPHVVAEGRRVINNIQRSASLFLVKNIFSLLLALISLGLPVGYPFQPLQLSLIAAVTIGLPSFVLALEPNRDRVQGRFMHNVLHAALPGGLTDFLLVLLAQGIAYSLGLSAEARATVCTLTALTVGVLILLRVCRPFTPLRRALWGSCTVLGYAGAVLLARWLGLVPLPGRGLALLAAVLASAPFVLGGFTRLVDAAWDAARAWRRAHRKTS